MNDLPGQPRSERRSRAKEVTIRIAEDQDRPAIRAMIERGLDEIGLPARHMVAEQRFLDSPESLFWVAQAPDGELIGMVSVLRVDDDTAELRRLRVEPDYRNCGIGRALVERALAYCRERALLKIVLDTYVERTPAIELFRKFGFHLARQRQVGARTVLDFYLDLYRDPRD